MKIMQMDASLLVSILMTLYMVPAIQVIGSFRAWALLDIWGRGCDEANCILKGQRHSYFKMKIK